MNPKNSPSRPVADKRLQLLNEGRALHAQGRIQDAFSRYQAAVMAAPEDAEALHLLGLAYLGLGQAQVGIAFVRRAIERSPGTAEYRANLATAEASQGRLDVALLQMQKVCELLPGDARHRAALAALHLRRDEAVEAEDQYQAAIESAAEPSSMPVPAALLAEWHEALAQLRYRRWAMAEALASAEQARALSAIVAKRINMGVAQAAGVPRDPAVSAPMLNLLAPIEAGALARACVERDLLVIDDFLPDPYARREQALLLCEEAAGSASVQGNFPGVQTPAQPSQPTMERIASALGRAVKWDSLDNGSLRVSIAADEARADVHVDNPTLTDIFGGVLYLSLPEHCQGGTRFYRHRDTCWERRPTLAELKSRGFASFFEFQKRSLPANRRLPFSEWLERRDALWEPLFEVPMRFNRLILFRSDFFHSITELFGDRMENGRLVQLFHFEGQPPEGN